MEDKGLLLFYDWKKTFEGLKGIEVKKLILAMMDYKKDGTEPPLFKGKAEVAADLMLAQVRREKEALLNRKKVGRPRKNQNDSLTYSRKERERDDALIYKECLENSEDEKENEIKKPYGKFNNVYLTNEEAQDLKKRYGDNLSRAIDGLSAYISSKGVKYNSHYATLISWELRSNNRSKEAFNDEDHYADIEEIIKQKNQRKNDA